MQLAFDREFKEIIDAEPNYWRSVEDIPKYIIQYIKRKSEGCPIHLFSQEKYLCNNCFEELDNNFYCHKCNKNYESSIYNDVCMYASNIKDLKYFKNNFYYYIFDVNKETKDVVLYLIKEEKYLYETSYLPKFISNIKIEGAYYITKDYYRELINNQFIYYDELDVMSEERVYDVEDKYMNPISNENFGFVTCNLFTYNIEDLKDTIYQYSNIWNNRDIINNHINLNLENLIYLPIHFPQFEYLTKLKLYRLAVECNKLSNEHNTFKGVTSLGKEYLEFMQKININCEQLEALKMCKKCDLELINFITIHLYEFKQIEKIIKINYEKVRAYFRDSKLDTQYISEYLDYLTIAHQLGMDMTDSKVLYPNNLLEEHDKFFTRIKMINDKDIDKRIQSLSSALSFNIYEDDKYIIIPATSIDSMISESNQQRNCLKSYCDTYSNGDCQIYFLREKENMDKSFVTIEVDKNNKVVQARGKYNELVSEDIMKIIKKWENSLIVDVK